MWCCLPRPVDWGRGCGEEFGFGVTFPYMAMRDFVAVRCGVVPGGGRRVE